MSEPRLITVRARTKSGSIQEFNVLEILTIDGKPYQPMETVDELIQHVNHLSGRVDAIEAIVGGNRE